jgi:hypothetical protein
LIGNQQCEMPPGAIDPEGSKKGARIARLARIALPARRADRWRSIEHRIASVPVNIVMNTSAASEILFCGMLGRWGPLVLRHKGFRFTGRCVTALKPLLVRGFASISSILA